MSVNADQVRHVARLARLALGDDEIDRMVPELNNILGWVDDARLDPAAVIGFVDQQQMPSIEAKECAGLVVATIVAGNIGF